ncbi:fumarylacetoacetate hydrolase family protein [Actinoallomurus sp. NPDC052274]|uniref:fumarylacetoacetate hydrolase family protein n=1 Tax=Actinoallomurus sp. NPDC052274 TaxID=3155420 RepID=UPI00341C61F1
MRIARVIFPDGTTGHGLVEGPPGSEVVAEIDGAPFGAPVRTGREMPLAETELLAPVVPTKVVVIGRNYADHARESPAADSDGTALIFLKPPSAVIGPGGRITLPPECGDVVFEGELAVVIGRRCRRVPAADTGSVIWGYTCANDVTARDLGRQTSSWTQAKSFDTFSPLGPWVSTGIDASDLRITTTVNDSVRQTDSTASMTRGIADLVAYVSSIMTLLPGDVILTGTPSGNGTVRHGDVVSVSIEEIGTLSNAVVGH